jgi:Mrp family chromosome partitioning ATPase
VDGVVLVVHCGRTKRETVERSIKQVQQFRGKVLGVVLNRKRYYIPDFIYRRL